MTGKLTPSTLEGRDSLDYSRLIVRPWIVSVRGFGEGSYIARSRGKALADAWRSSAFEGWTFGEFLKNANCYAGLGPFARFGERIIVGGEPAFWVGCNRQYISFVRPDSDVVLTSHPYDVEPPEARRGTPYYTALDTGDLE